MHVRKLLISAALALSAVFALASPAPAATIANPLGTSFSGTGWVEWWVIDTDFEIRCNATLDGTPPPATVGVVPNTLGGSPGRMAQYRPALTGCVAYFGGITFPAPATVNCDWAHSANVYTTGPNPTQFRMQIGLGCPSPSSAVRIVVPALGCTVDIAQQQHFGSGYNTPVAVPPTGMYVAHSLVSAVTRTATGCPAIGSTNPPFSMTAAFQFTGVWAGP